MATEANVDVPPTEPAAAETSTDADLPKSVVQRIVRAKAIQIIEAANKAPNTADKKAPNVQISKEALMAFAESGKVFINYLTCMANDCAKESKRVTISTNDVFKALEELEFGEFLQPLQQYLEAHKGTLKEKPATKKKEGGSTSKKRKAEIHAVADEAHAVEAPQPSPVPIAALQQEPAEQMETAA